MGCSSIQVSKYIYANINVDKISQLGIKHNAHCVSLDDEGKVFW